MMLLRVRLNSMGVDKRLFAQIDRYNINYKYSVG
jgi:hypothetical protein